VRGPSCCIPKYVRRRNLRANFTKFRAIEIVTPTVSLTLGRTIAYVIRPTVDGIIIRKWILTGAIRSGTRVHDDDDDDDDGAPAWTKIGRGGINGLHRAAVRVPKR